MQNVRAAMAWCTVPSIWSLVLSIPALALFGQALFTNGTLNAEAPPTMALATIGFESIQILLGIWSVIVGLVCLGQVQGFSAWKVLGNVILATLVFAPIFALLLIIALLLALIVHLFADIVVSVAAVVAR